jgi:thioredoxin reductase (NADPH)
MGDSYEAVVIGGGPAGLTAGIYLMRAGIKTVLLEKQLLGGAPVATDHVENYPGFPDGISGQDLMKRMAEQARRLDLPIVEFSRVDWLGAEEGGVSCRVEAESFRSIGTILAMGTEPMKLDVPGEETFLGRGVSYCATCDAMFFRGLDVVVIGGGDAALSEALSLANVVGKVYIVHRRQQLRAQKILQDRAERNDRIRFLLNKVPVEICGHDQVESIRLRDTVTKEESDLKVAGVFSYVGSRPDTAFLGDLVETDEKGFVVTNECLETGTPGLWAAGDVRKKSLRQITTAVGDGALAAVNLERYILERR